MADNLKFSVKSDIKRLTRALNGMERKAILPATVSTLNRVGQGVLGDTRRELSKQMGAPQKAIKGNLGRTKARRTHLTVDVWGRGRHMNIIEFKGRQTKKGVSAAPWNRRRLFKGAFVAPGQHSGKQLAFTRTSKDRYPIKAIYGPAIPTTMVSAIVRRLMNESAAKRFATEFPRQLKFRLEKLRR